MTRRDTLVYLAILIIVFVIVALPVAFIIDVTTFLRDRARTGTEIGTKPGGLWAKRYDVYNEGEDERDG